MYSTALYFSLKKKQIIKISNEYKVVRSATIGQVSFQFDQLTSITSSLEDINKLFELFSKTHLAGSYNSFARMILLNAIEPQNKLTWTDSILKNPNQINRQTLLEFLSQLFSGFENLNNQSIRKLVAFYFQDESGNELKISSKNISDW